MEIIPEQRMRYMLFDCCLKNGKSAEVAWCERDHLNNHANPAAIFRPISRPPPPHPEIEEYQMCTVGGRQFRSVLYRTNF